MEWFFGVFTGSTVLLLLLYVFVYGRLTVYRPPSYPSASWLRVSVIICARNEAANLTRHLPRVLSQRYPGTFEVVVVNDCSTDGTGSVLKSLQRTHDHLRVITVKAENPALRGKKNALTQGVSAAQHDVLVVTDADCYPDGPHWLRQMATHFSDPQTSFVLGYSPPVPHPRSLLNVFIRYDTFYTAMQYFSWALAGLPYMGTGRNMAYRRQVFERAGGLASHGHILSGDDDLLVNRQADVYNTRIELHPESTVYTGAPTSVRAFIRQKQRHLTAGFLYRPLHKCLLGGAGLLKVLFYLSFTVLLAHGTSHAYFIPACYLFAFKTLTQYIVFLKPMQRLHVGTLWACLLPLDIIYCLFYLILALYRIRYKPVKWA